MLQTNGCPPPDHPSSPYADDSGSYDQQPGEVINYWGALARDEQGAVFASKRYATDGEAEDAVLADCRAHGKGECKVIVDFSNGWIGLAEDDESYYWQNGTFFTARYKAMRVCKQSKDRSGECRFTGLYNAM